MPLFKLSPLPSALSSPLPPSFRSLSSSQSPLAVPMAAQVPTQGSLPKGLSLWGAVWSLLHGVHPPSSLDGPPAEWVEPRQ